MVGIVALERSLVTRASALGPTAAQLPSDSRTWQLLQSEMIPTHVANHVLCKSHMPAHRCHDMFRK